MFRPLAHSARVHKVRKSDGLFFASLISYESIKRIFGDAKTILDSAQIFSPTRVCALV